MSDTHHCPFCELIFRDLPELQDHISIDHPDRHVPDREHHEYHRHPDSTQSNQGRQDHDEKR